MDGLEADADVSALPQGPRAAVARILEGRRVQLAGLALTSLAGGGTEALFLVVVTRVAFAITEDRGDLDVPGGFELSVEAAVGIAFVLVVVRLAMAVVTSVQSARLTSEVVAKIRRDLSSAFLEATWSVQQDDRSGRLQELLTTFAQRGSELVNSLTLGVAAACSLLALLTIAIVLDPVGALVMILSVVLLGLSLRPLRASVRRRSQRSADAGMQFATSLNEISQLGLEMHVFQVQPQTGHQVDGLISETAQAEQRLTLMRMLVPQIYTGLAYLALVAALGVVALSSSADVAGLGTVMLVMLRSLSYGQAIQNSSAHVVATAPFVETLGEELARYRRGRRHDAGGPVGAVGQLDLHHVTFSYAPNQPVLKDVSIAIPPAAVVGVVGPSGGGKSTLVQLLLGLREPDSGEVLAGGRHVRDLSRQEWARKVTFVPQTPRLFGGTIAENVRFYRDGVGPAEVETACRATHLHDEIVQHPDGYDRQVGERGGHLSGGQQQRLCIARALVEQPDILILDEPTSALDVRSEQLIQQTLTGLRGRVTIIIIAHRLSTLDVCDRILVIQDGEVRGYDTPENLSRSNAFFHEVLGLAGLR